jgi:hypothetical protein
MTNRLLYNIFVIFIVIFYIIESYSLKTNKITNSIKDKPQTYVDVSSLVDSNVSNFRNVIELYFHIMKNMGSIKVC